MEQADKQVKKQLPEPMKAYMWKKGQSGNVLGRPKGKTMKEWARQYMERMTDEERDEFMEGIPKEVIWKMAEGNPETKQETTVIIPEPIAPTKPLTNEILTNNSVQEDTKPTEENQNSTGGDFSIEDSLKLNLLDSQSTDGQNTNSN